MLIADEQYFNKRLEALEQVLPLSAESVRPVLVDIHRSARKLHEILSRIDATPPSPAGLFTRISCFDCGTHQMDTFHTSKQGGYHLCPPCFHHRVTTGRARFAQ